MNRRELVGMGSVYSVSVWAGTPKWIQDFTFNNLLFCIHIDSNPKKVSASKFGVCSGPIADTHSHIRCTGQGNVSMNAVSPWASEEQGLELMKCVVEVEKIYSLSDLIS